MSCLFGFLFKPALVYLRVRPSSCAVQLETFSGHHVKCPCFPCSYCRKKVEHYSNALSLFLVCWASEYRPTYPKLFWSDFYHVGIWCKITSIVRSNLIWSWLRSWGFSTEFWHTFHHQRQCVNNCDKTKVTGHCSNVLSLSFFLQSWRLFGRNWWS